MLKAETECMLLHAASDFCLQGNQRLPLPSGQLPATPDKPSHGKQVQDLVCCLFDLTGTTTSLDLRAELQRLASNQLVIAAEPATKQCDLCKQPTLFSYYEAVSTHTQCPAASVEHVV